MVRERDRIADARLRERLHQTLAARLPDAPAHYARPGRCAGATTCVFTHVISSRISDANCIFFVLARHQTPTTLLTLGTHLLCTHPEVLASLREDPGRWPAAVEEMLRLITPTAFTGATPRADADIDGVTCPAGSRACCSWPPPTVTPPPSLPPTGSTSAATPTPPQLLRRRPLMPGSKK